MSDTMPQQSQSRVLVRNRMNSVCYSVLQWFSTQKRIISYGLYVACVVNVNANSRDREQQLGPNQASSDTETHKSVICEIIQTSHYIFNSRKP